MDEVLRQRNVRPVLRLYRKTSAGRSGPLGVDDRPAHGHDGAAGPARPRLTCRRPGRRSSRGPAGGQAGDVDARRSRWASCPSRDSRPIPGARPPPRRRRRWRPPPVAVSVAGSRAGERRACGPAVQHGDARGRRCHRGHQHVIGSGSPPTGARCTARAAGLADGQPDLVEGGLVPPRRRASATATSRAVRTCAGTAAEGGARPWA